MPQEYDYDLRIDAEEHYVIDGLTYEQVAQKIGVALNTVKNWAAEGEWRKKREEHRAALRDIRSTVTSLRTSLLAKAKGSLDPQDIYAAVRLESVVQRQEKKTEEILKIDKPALFLENIEFIVSVLKEVDPEGLKILATNFDAIVERFKKGQPQGVAPTT